MMTRCRFALSLVVCGMAVVTTRCFGAAPPPDSGKRPTVEDSTGQIAVLVWGDSSVRAMSREALSEEKGKLSPGHRKDCVVLTCQKLLVGIGAGTDGKNPLCISAFGDAVIEGEGFTAKASVIEYVPATGALAVESEGSCDARLWLQRAGDSALSVVSGPHIRFRRGHNEIHVEGLLPSMGAEQKPSTGSRKSCDPPPPAPFQGDGPKTAPYSGRAGSDSDSWIVSADGGQMRLKARQLRLAIKGNRWSFQLAGKAGVELGDFRGTADKIDAAYDKELKTVQFVGSVSLESEDFRATADSAELDLTRGMMQMNAQDGRTARLQRESGGDRVHLEASSIRFDGAHRRITTQGAATLHLQH